MNFHSDKWIMERVMEHLQEAETLVPTKHIVGIFYHILYLDGNSFEKIASGGDIHEHQNRVRFVVRFT